MPHAFDVMLLIDASFAAAAGAAYAFAIRATFATLSS